MLLATTTTTNIAVCTYACIHAPYIYIYSVRMYMQYECLQAVLAGIVAPHIDSKTQYVNCASEIH